MKYYAVTDDPTELMHYGIKGMKWGIIRTDAQLGHPKKPKATKPRSPAYQKASSKLSSAMQRGIAKAQKSWNVYNSPANKQLRAEKRDYNKAVRDYKRGERKFEKHVQLARQGRLKYKGISDSEIQRITDRLMLENRARQQSGNEKQSFRRRLNESIGNGIISGVGQGTSTYISTRMQGRAQQTNKIKEAKRMAAYQNSLQGRLAQNRVNRAKERDVTAQARRDFDKEYYKMLIDEGQPIRGRGREKALGLVKGTVSATKGLIKANADAYADAAERSKIEGEPFNYSGISAKDQFNIIRNSYKNANLSRATRKSRARALAERRASKNTGANSQAIRETNQDPSSNITQTASSIIRPTYQLKRGVNYVGTSNPDEPISVNIHKRGTHVYKRHGRR